MSKVVIATHVYASGPAQELKKYLIDKKIEKLLFIGHPLFYLERLKGSGYDIYSKGKVLKSKHRKITKFSVNVFYYPLAVLKNIFWTLKFGTNWDFFVGCNNLNTLAGLMLRKLNFVDKVIYYVVDFNPKRFKNTLLNKVFHKVELYCAREADETWNLSPRMIKGRKELHGSVIGGYQKVAPMGAWLGRIKAVSYEKCLQTTVVFMGHILEKQGLQLVIKAIPPTLKFIPNFKLRVIGDGPYLKTLRELVKSLDIEQHVDFLGYVEDYERIERLIAESVLAVALYDPKNISFTYYADPGKIKTYLGAGVPVIMTDVAHISKDISRSSAGVLVKYSVDALVAAFKDLLGSPVKVQKLRKNALNLGRGYDWGRIYKNLGID